ncbi:hypothetical protein EW146_g6370 [Bondarzewia mesenterica]|uniref:F-box domain-containing protein n=1 Tax=Bondarzewia mesenterica TaxID=1095465 RepID=A0A4S4LUH1_9AGAM|nr:hypothetical protein EW146_g6370 [Bondarzewia mesenterica]
MVEQQQHLRNAHRVVSTSRSGACTSETSDLEHSVKELRSEIKQSEDRPQVQSSWDTELNNKEPPFEQPPMEILLCIFELAAGRATHEAVYNSDVQAMEIPLFYRTLVESTNHIPQLVKRIHLNCVVHPHHLSPHANVVNEYMHSILGLCRNLQYFDIYDTVRSANLRAIALEASPHFRNLTSLVLGPCVDATFKVPDLSLPGLRTFQCSRLFLIHSTHWSFPRLENWTLLILSDQKISRSDLLSRSVIKFLEMSGAMLRFLHFYGEWERQCMWDFSNDDPQKVWKSVLDELPILCPFLRHLVTFPMPPSNFSGHPALNWIDMWDSSFTSDVAEEVRESMCDTQGFPQLRIVRRLDVALSLYIDLPTMIPPDVSFFNGASTVIWRLPGMDVAQTKQSVMRLNLKPDYFDDDLDSVDDPDEDSSEWSSSEEEGWGMSDVEGHETEMKIQRSIESLIQYEGKEE